MDRSILELAASTLHISPEEVEKNHKQVLEAEAWYFWNPVRGGGAVIINAEKEKLGATSSVSYERHVKAFLDGRRS